MTSMSYIVKNWPRYLLRWIFFTPRMGIFYRETWVRSTRSNTPEIYVFALLQYVWSSHRFCAAASSFYVLISTALRRHAIGCRLSHLPHHLRTSPHPIFPSSTNWGKMSPSGRQKGDWCRFQPACVWKMSPTGRHKEDWRALYRRQRAWKSCRPEGDSRGTGEHLT